MVRYARVSGMDDGERTGCSHSPDARAVATQLCDISCPELAGATEGEVSMQQKLLPWGRFPGNKEEREEIS